LESAIRFSASSLALALILTASCSALALILSAFTCGQTQTEQQQPTHIESIMVGTPSATSLSMKHKKLTKLLHKMFVDLIFFSDVFIWLFPKKNSFETNKQTKHGSGKKEERDWNVLQFQQQTSAARMICSALASSSFRSSIAFASSFILFWSTLDWRKKIHKQS
jgi:hypothetical protein